MSKGGKKQVVRRRPIEEGARRLAEATKMPLDDLVLRYTFYTACAHLFDLMVGTSDERTDEESMQLMTDIADDLDQFLMELAMKQGARGRA
jgi:hypothetical protein